MSITRNLEEERAQKSQRSILLVEDNQEIYNLLAAILTRIGGYRVLGMHSAEQVLLSLDTILENSPCLFIFDYLLGTVNGINLYDQIHAVEEFKHVPALIITALASVDIDRQLQERGLLILRKPFNIQTLLQTVEGLIST